MSAADQAALSVLFSRFVTGGIKQRYILKILNEYDIMIPA